MILLTGGAGFIGSCFLKKLNLAGRNDIIVVDRLGNSLKWKNLVVKNYQDYFHKTEFRNRLNNGEFEGKFDTIFHIGACSETTESDADYLMDNNFAYSKTLAEYSIRNNARFIYASSAATYGNGSEGYSDTVFDKLKPLNPYGYSKHLFDLWVIQKGYDKLFTGLKYFNVFGPNEYHKGSMASMVYKSFHQAKINGKIRLFKSNHPDFDDGGQKRDFVYIKDVVDIMWLIFENPGITGIYNIGTGIANTWNNLAGAVFSALELKENIEYIDMPDNLEEQYQNYTCADMRKLFDKIGGFNFQSLNDSVEDYIKNYLLHEWQYE